MREQAGDEWQCRLPLAYREEGDSPYLKATRSTASLILLTITSASSVPCLPFRL
jgi:hypothetical protein